MMKLNSKMNRVVYLYDDYDVIMSILSDGENMNERVGRCLGRR